MKSISNGLKTHLAGEVTTLATLWKITRLDNKVFAFTDHTRDITYGGITYLASTSYAPSAIKTTAALNVDNLEVQSFLDSETITEHDLMAGLWDYATVLVMRINYMSPGDGVEIMRKGTLGNVKTGKTSFVAELRGMTQPLQQAIGRIFTPGCDADLGDTRCGVSISSYTVTGTVTSVISGHEFKDTGRTESSGWFNDGMLTWTSGNNNTYKMEVKTFTNGTFFLQQAMPNAIQVGDTYSVHAGCDKTLSTCKNKFDNVINFRGFPHVPGNDRMMAGT